MRKKIISIGISLLLIFNLTANTNASPTEMESKLLNVSKYISTYYTYGSGLSLSSGLNAITEYKIGACSQTSYTMSRYAESQGLQSRVVSIFARSGLNHAVTEVFINNHWEVFDALNGVYYPHSVAELISNTDLLNNIVGVPIELTKIYTTPDLWGDINQIKYYQLHDYEPALPSQFVNSSSNFIAPNNLASNVTDYSDNIKYAAVSTVLANQPTWITIDLLKTYDVTRIAIDWYSFANYATKFELLGSIDGVNYFTLHNQNGSSSPVTEIPLDTQFRYLKFTSSEYHGQQRLLIRDIKVYSDKFDWDHFLGDS